jgi:hypothetical protein
VTKSDFIDWKRHPVTQQVYSQLNSRIAYFTEQLVEQAAYLDPRILAEKSGAIRAYQDMLNIEFDEESHGN